MLNKTLKVCKVTERCLLLQETKYLAARDALVANLNLQNRLTETLKELEDGITANAERQAKIEAAAQQGNRYGWYLGRRSKNPCIWTSLLQKAQPSSNAWMSSLHEKASPNCLTQGAVHR